MGVQRVLVGLYWNIRERRKRRSPEEVGEIQCRYAAFRSPLAPFVSFVVFCSTSVSSYRSQSGHGTDPVSTGHERGIVMYSHRKQSWYKKSPGAFAVCYQHRGIARDFAATRSNGKSNRITDRATNRFRLEFQHPPSNGAPGHAKAEVVVPVLRRPVVPVPRTQVRVPPAPAPDHPVRAY